MALKQWYIEDPLLDEYTPILYSTKVCMKFVGEHRMEKKPDISSKPKPSTPIPSLLSAQSTFLSGLTGHQTLTFFVITRLPAALTTLVRYSRCTHRSCSTYQQPIHEAPFSSQCFFKASLVFLCKHLRCIWSRGIRNRRSHCR